MFYVVCLLGRSRFGEVGFRLGVFVELMFGLLGR